MLKGEASWSLGGNSLVDGRQAVFCPERLDSPECLHLCVEVVDSDEICETHDHRRSDAPWGFGIAVDAHRKNLE